MPCYDDRNEPAYVAADVRRDCRHNSDVADLLCSVLRHYPNIVHEMLDDVCEVRGLRTWWKEHQERDHIKAKNEKQEKKRKSANKLATLNKLAKELRKKVV